MSDILIEMQAICSIPPNNEGRATHPIKTGYRASLGAGTEYGIAELSVPSGVIYPGQSAEVIVRAIVSEDLSRELHSGSKFDLREHPMTTASCEVISVLKIERIV